MKFFTQVAVIIIGAIILEMILPWWSIAIAAFLAGYALKSKANFLAGFLAIALLWITKAWLIDSAGLVPLAEKVAAIFSLTKPLLLLVTGLIGGLVSGFAAMAGASLKKEKRGYY